MAANGYVEVGEVSLGTGKKSATYTFTEDALLKFLQRTALNSPLGLDVMGEPGDTAWTGTGDAKLLTLLKVLALGMLSTADNFVEPHQPLDVVPFTPTIDTSIYGAGDVLFITAPIQIARANDLRAMLSSLTVIDKAKQNAAITLLFYQTNVTSAAINAANAMSDSDQINLLGYFDILAADWKTYANNSVVCYSGAKAPGLLLEAATASQNVYCVGLVGTGSTPTYASTSDLVFKLGFVQQ
jgi:hypothetical protein